VDLIRNDLSQVADSVRVARFRYIDRIKTHTGKALLQVSSKVVGNLPADYHAHLGDILASLLPAGSISGAPKKKTVEIIKEAESAFNCGNLPYTRHFYTGVCGYFDGENLDTGVMIRYVERVGEGLYFKSGGGITTQSTLESEYNELIQKIYVPIA
jgi:para-aminobenzoate synthetase component 1